jgi:hypothetical protein
MYPSWFEYILKLSRARGYWTIYPNFKSTEVLATMHTELFQLPEEYLDEPEVASPDFDFDLTADPAHPFKRTEATLLSKSLLSALPSNGDLPAMAEMPLLSWDGGLVEVAEIEHQAADYSRIFQHEIGGCDVSVAQKKRVGLKAGDLFCFDDDSPEVKQ